MSRTLHVSFAAVVCLVASRYSLVAAAEPDVVAELRAKAAAVTSYQAAFTLTVFEEERPTTLTGTIAFQRPDRRRIEFSGDRPADDVAQLVVSDGTAEWQYFPETKTVYKTDWATLRGAGLPPEVLEARGLHQPFIDLKPETLRLAETKTEGPQTLYVVEGEPTATLVAEAPFAPGVVRVTVSAEDGLTRRLTMTDAQGREVLIQDYSGIQLNVPVEASTFVFTPPKGTEVVNISEDRARAAQTPAPTGGSSS